MRFKIKVVNARGEWPEEYDKPFVTDLKSAEKFAADIVASFNRTLRSGETKRKVVDVHMTTDEENADAPYEPLRHQWEKVSIVTETGGYDRMRCTHCGLKGKRWGLGAGGVLADSTNPKMRDCNYAYRKLILKEQRVTMQSLRAKAKEV